MTLAASARAQAARATPSTHIEDAAVFVERDFIWQRTSEGPTPLVPLAAIRLAGRHMLSNVAAATAIAHAAGRPAKRWRARSMASPASST